ncbi:Transposase_28 domain-containing protein [Cephalotus follicularis]|uniref:Transposase_28 domain-containing protein n=1 Tax=Cephalotus follicularis TaxID=3775 RepID=A0A1Q3CEV5_CEPFO|nr:Transposase_28 domain-containing protein [Cephalotus follicularis]
MDEVSDVAATGVAFTEAGVQVSKTLFDISVLSRDKVSALAKKYCFPRGLICSLPQDPNEATESKPDLFVVFMDALEHGLRLPIPSFALAILRHFKIHLSLLQAQSWAFIIGFLVKCLEIKATATVRLFKEFHALAASPGKRGHYFKSRPGLTKKLLVDPTKSVKGWRGRYFLVKNLPGFAPCQWSNSLDIQCLNKRSVLTDAKKVDMAKLSALEREGVNHTIFEDRLRRVGLSMSSGRRYHLDDEEEIPTGIEREGVQNSREEPEARPVAEGESCIKPSSSPLLTFYFWYSFNLVLHTFD